MSKPSLGWVSGAERLRLWQWWFTRWQTNATEDQCEEVRLQNTRETHTHTKKDDKRHLLWRASAPYQRIQQGAGAFGRFSKNRWPPKPCKVWETVATFKKIWDFFLILKYRKVKEAFTKFLYKSDGFHFKVSGRPEAAAAFKTLKGGWPDR